MEKPTLFTGKDGLLHFIVHEHGQCNRTHAQFLSKNTVNLGGPCFRAPPFGGGADPDESAFLEPKPVPVKGGGVFRGDIGADVDRLRPAVDRRLRHTRPRLHPGAMKLDTSPSVDHCDGPLVGPDCKIKV